MNNLAPQDTALALAYHVSFSKDAAMVDHIPILREYSAKCGHVTEFGVRLGISTLSFIAGQPKEIHSYDIEQKPEVAAYLCQMALDNGVNFTFHVENTLEAEIEPTDFCL